MSTINSESSAIPLHQRIGRGRAKNRGKVKGNSSRRGIGIGAGKLPDVPDVPDISLPSYLNICIITKALKDDSLMMELFHDWMRDYDRTYPTIEEQAKRFEVFKYHAQEVLDQRARGRFGWGMNGFADITAQEFRDSYLGRGCCPGSSDSE